MNLIIKEVENLFALDSTKVVVDTLNQAAPVTDTLTK
jgi:hypothetical protein